MTHPMVAAASDVRSSLKAVADANPTFMSVEEKATALQDLVAAEGQMVELRLRILADAGDLAAGTAAKDAAGWLAHDTRTRYADARADLRLAEALDRDRQRLAAAMREGGATLAQAHVIDRALSALPTGVDAQVVAEAEAHLVERAREFGPKELGRIGRRILDVVAPEVAEAAEGVRLAELEAHAAERTRLTMRRLGEGTTRISSIVPDAAATRFASYLEAHANPRRTPVDNDPDQRCDAGTPTTHDPVARLARPRRMGEAFVAFLETVDAGRLPIHGGNATSVIVTIPLDALRAELAAADLIGSGLVPGDDLTGDRISASEARRLACTPGSSRPSWEVEASLSTSAAHAGSTTPPSAWRWRCATRRVAPRAATSPPTGARPTTSIRGSSEAAPTSTTASWPAVITTTGSMTRDIWSNASPTGTSASTGAPRPQGVGTGVIVRAGRPP